MSLPAEAPVATTDLTMERPRMHSVVGPASGTRSSRVWFVDFLRLLASLQMVNGHTLDAVMRAELRSGPIYADYLWWRGLVAVAFLVVSGIAFHLSSLSSSASTAGGDRARARRFLVLLVLGYLLHNPLGMLFVEGPAREELWHDFMRVDVLSCIGATLLCLLVLKRLLRNEQRVALVAGLLGVAILLGAPLTANWANPADPTFFGQWMSPQAGSPFPIVPWAGFLLLGVALGAFALPLGARTPLRTTLVRLSLSGLCALALAELLRRYPVPWYAPELHGPVVSPALAIERLAAVLGLLLVLDILCRPIRKVPGIIRALSAETLTIYIVHLLILFFPLFNLAGRIGPTLNLHAALALSGANLLVSATAAALWHRRRRRRAVPVEAQGLRRSIRHDPQRDGRGGAAR